MLLVSPRIQRTTICHRTQIDTSATGPWSVAFSPLYKKTLAFWLNLRYNVYIVKQKGAQMLKQAFNTLAKAKIIKNKKLDTLRVIIAFNVTQTNKKGQYIFPVSKKCAYVSGDLLAEDVLTEIQRAKQLLRTNNIVIV